MKKLMIAAAIVCAAAASQAAMISWGFGGKVGLMDGVDENSAIQANKASATLAGSFKNTGLALVYLGQNVSKIDYAEILASTDAEYTGKYKIVDTMGFGFQTSGSNANKGKWDPTQKDYTIDSAYTAGATFAVVVFDGAEYGQAKEFTGVNSTSGVGDVGDALATPIVSLTADQLAGLATIDTMYVTGGASVNGAIAVGNVPEPTSGLLLLLGVAGLALKRKRA